MSDTGKNKHCESSWNPWKPPSMTGATACVYVFFLELLSLFTTVMHKVMYATARWLPWNLLYLIKGDRKQSLFQISFIVGCWARWLYVSCSVITHIQLAFRVCFSPWTVFRVGPVVSQSEGCSGQERLISNHESIQLQKHTNTNTHCSESASSVQLNIN